MSVAPRISESARFYDMTGLWWGDPGIRDSDRKLARRVDRGSGGPLRVLELGAGFGGAAAATAALGHRVVGVEASPVRAALARRHTFGRSRGQLTILEADFFEVGVTGRFDAVAYWNGFGLGTDDDQRRLLRRIRGWLRTPGLVLMHVYDPVWWEDHAGSHRRRDGLVQEIGFDPGERSLVDRWWPEGRPDDLVCERIRCYSETDLEGLLDGTALELVQVERDDGSPWKYLVELRPV